MASTALPQTEAGVVMGTIGYMAPEQVRGLPADYRADVFSFGCILYEMWSGERAFRRDTTPETMTAILKDDPAPLENPGIDRIVRHCLESLRRTGSNLQVTWHLLWRRSRQHPV